MLGWRGAGGAGGAETRGSQQKAGGSINASEEEAKKMWEREEEEEQGRKKLVEGNKAMREAIEDGSRTESFTGGRETEKNRKKKPEQDREK